MRVLVQFVVSVLFLALCAQTTITPTHAQTAVASIDLVALGLARTDIQPVDTDHNPWTQEWLARSWDTNLYTVIAQRTQVCVGAWFDPRPHLFSTVTVSRVGTVDMLLVRSPFDNVLRLIALHTPSCS